LFNLGGEKVVIVSEVLYLGAFWPYEISERIWLFKESHYKLT